MNENILENGHQAGNTFASGSQTHCTVPSVAVAVMEIHLYMAKSKKTKKQNKPNDEIIRNRELESGIWGRKKWNRKKNGKK